MLTFLLELLGDEFLINYFELSLFMFLGEVLSIEIVSLKIRLVPMGDCAATGEVPLILLLGLRKSPRFFIRAIYSASYFAASISYAFLTSSILYSSAFFSSSCFIRNRFSFAAFLLLFSISSKRRILSSRSCSSLRDLLLLKRYANFT